MTTGLLIGLLIFYYTHLASAQTAALKKAHANFSLVLVHLYYVPGLSGILYPGADWTDPEFGERPPQAELLVGCWWRGGWRGGWGGRNGRRCFEGAVGVAVLGVRWTVKRGGIVGKVNIGIFLLVD